MCYPYLYLISVKSVKTHIFNTFFSRINLLFYSSPHRRPFVWLQSWVWVQSLLTFMTPVNTSFSHISVVFGYDSKAVHGAVLHLPPWYSHYISLEFPTLCNSQDWGKYFHYRERKRLILCGCVWMMQSCRLETQVRLELTWALKKSWGDLTRWPVIIGKCSTECSCVFWRSAKLLEINNTITSVCLHNIILELQLQAPEWNEANSDSD